MAEPRALLELAAALADGTPVDWAAAEARLAESGDDGLARQLRILSEVADLHRSGQAHDAARHPDGIAGSSTTRPAEPRVPAHPGTIRAGDRWGDLILLEEIGSGSFGTVYKAHDRNLDRTVALKLLRPRSSTDAELVTRVLHEGRTLARVRHPNVVVVHGAGTHDDQVGLWMDFVRGETLRTALTRGGTLSAEEASAIGIKLCQALAAVHAKDLVHADVKAQNVMREAGGRIVLMDFGAVRPTTMADAADDGRLAGTPLYMAPELFVGGAPSVASDIYALGVLLFHLVAKRFPVEAPSIGALAVAHAQRDRRLLRDVRPDVPSAFVEAVEKATDPDPGNRYQSVGALERALADVLAPPTSEAREPAADGATSVWLRRLGAVAGVTVALGLLGYISMGAFNIFLRIPRQFAPANPVDYVFWGLQAVIPIAFYWTQWIILAGITVGVGRLGRKGFRRARAGKATLLPAPLSRALDHAARAGLDPSVGAAAGVVLAVAAYVGLTWYFGDIFGTLNHLEEARPGEIVDVTVLSPGSHALHRLHATTYSALSFLIALALWYLPRLDARRQADRPARLMKGALVILFGVTVITAVIPYRVLWKNEAERLSFGGQRAYILGQTDTDLLLYVPNAATTTQVIVDRHDARLERPGERVVESVFTAE
jgi:hypothetical protein